LLEYSALEYERRLAAARKSMVTLLAHPVFETTRLALENTLTCQFGARPCDLRELLACGPPHKLGFVLDTSHSVFDHSPRQFMEAFPERLLGFHLSDNDRSRSRDLHAPPLSLADSAIDWAEFRALHHKHRLPRSVILERLCPPGQTLEILLSLFRESARKLSDLFSGPPAQPTPSLCQAGSASGEGPRCRQVDE
jgi:sugar phosphate isomerase/epimerase